MSNCVNIYKNVVMPLANFDHERLFKDIDAANAHKSDPDPEGNTLDGSQGYFWWFLGRDNVRVVGDKLVINLGGHRSGHTQRDLRGCGWILSDYLIPKLTKGQQCKIILDATDEYDGHEEHYRHEWILEPWEQWRDREVR